VTKTGKKRSEETTAEPLGTPSEVPEKPAAANESPTGADTDTGAAETPADATPPEEVDWHDHYLRLAAEFDNFRKRSAREFESVVRNAEGDLIAELTVVLDNLDRAADGDHKGESATEFAQGIVMIRDQLRKTLEGRGLERMETVGREFDPLSHDALMRAPSDEHDEGVITQEVVPGYSLKGKVLRHAQVVVSQGKAEDENSSSE